MAFNIALSAITALLLFVGYIVALVFAVARRHHLGPRPASFLITGLAVLLFLDAIEVTWPFVFGRLYGSFGSGMEVGTIIGAVGLITGLLHLIGVVLIVLAVFAGRGTWLGTPTAYPAGPPLAYPPQALPSAPPADAQAPFSAPPAPPL